MSARPQPQAVLTSSKMHDGRLARIPSDFAHDPGYCSRSLSEFGLYLRDSRHALTDLAYYQADLRRGLIDLQRPTASDTRNRYLNIDSRVARARVLACVAGDPTSQQSS